MSTAYLLILCGGVLLSACVYCFLNRRDTRTIFRAVLTVLMSSALGLIVCKALYMITQIDYTLAYGFSETLFTLDPLRCSFYGAAAGACLGAALAGKWTGMRPLQALNRFAPAGILMAAVARFGEYFLENKLYGCGRYFDIETEPFFCRFPISIGNEWDEYYLAVFMLEGICCLAVFALSVFGLKKDRFIRSLFYFCLPQILCESLRRMSFVWHEFVKVEQLLCMLVMEGILLYYALKTPKTQRNRFLPPILGLVAAGIFVAVEFALDKSDLPHLLTYAVMVLGMGLLAFSETLGWKRASLDTDAFTKT